MKLSLDLILELVKVDSVGSEGFFEVHSVEPGFFCSESVPASLELNRYEISVYTEASHPGDVHQLHNKLVMIWEEIAEVWPIVTGYRRGLSNRKQTDTPGYRSNIDEVMIELQRKEGLSFVTSDFPFGRTRWGNYEKPPVADALILRKECISDPKLKILIGYYHKALENKDIKIKDYWSLPLYKIKDQLEIIHNKKEISELRITKADLTFFEDNLSNHDLRHPGYGDRAKPINAEDKNKLFLIARCWIARELDSRSLPFSKKGLENLLV